MEFGTAVEAGAGRDKYNPVHAMKEADVECGAYGEEKLENNQLYISSGS